MKRKTILIFIVILISFTNIYGQLKKIPLYFLEHDVNIEKVIIKRYFNLPDSIYDISEGYFYSWMSCRTEKIYLLCWLKFHSPTIVYDIFYVVATLISTLHDSYLVLRYCNICNFDHYFYSYSGFSEYNIIIKFIDIDEPFYDIHPDTMKAKYYEKLSIDDNGKFIITRCESLDP